MPAKEEEERRSVSVELVSNYQTKCGRQM